VARFFGEQGFAILLGDLIVIRMDFAEGQKTVAIAPKSTKAACNEGSTRVTLAR